MNVRELTEKQQAVLDFIRRHLEEYDSWPKYRHYADEFGFRSPNSVFQNLKALEQKGYIVRDGAGYRLCREIKRTSGIPVVGEITAGCLQEAVEAELGSITLDMLFPKLDRIYALRVNGNSMRGTGINSGDYVLLMDDDIPNGGIGAVLYNGETSLKRIFWDVRGLRLEPTNKEYEEIIIEPEVFEEVRVLGRYVGHLNRSGLFKAPSTLPPVASSNPGWYTSRN
ncbi:MAG: transcriptional repressor LexA [Bacteroidota bacterium]|nr:transcriptional repressor LexA [Bacteroidota bacterium]